MAVALPQESIIGFYMSLLSAVYDMSDSTDTSVFKGGRATTSFISAAAEIGSEQALRVGDWSLHAGLSVMEQARGLTLTLCSESVICATYLLGRTCEVIIKLYDLSAQLLPHVLHGECKLLGI